MEQLLLKDVCSFANGKAHEQFVDENGKYILVTSKFIASNGESFRRTNDRLTPLEIGDLCMVMSDVPRGRALAKCFLVDKNDTYTLNQRIGAFKADDRFLKKYFYYQMNRNKYFLSFDDGDSQTNLRKDDILNCPLYCPSKVEQQVIVDILDKVSLVIKRRQEQLQDLDNLIQARFVELFGDPSLNTKGYPIKSLPEIAEYWNGLTYKPEDVADEGTIVLRSSNIQNAQLDFEDTVRVTCSIGEKKYVKDNDILMCSRNGSARLVGKVALIKDIKEPMSFGAFMMIIRSQYYPYLMTFFQMPSFRAQITTGATTTINQITGRMLDNVKLPVPEKAELNSFISFIEQVDKSKVVVQRSLDETEKLFDSLMQEFFE